MIGKYTHSDTDYVHMFFGAAQCAAELKKAELQSTDPAKTLIDFGAAFGELATLFQRSVDLD